ncbi:hypothetical protein ABFS82_10G152200 [Erythranthe guttata]
MNCWAAFHYKRESFHLLLLLLVMILLSENPCLIAADERFSTRVKLIHRNVYKGILPEDDVFVAEKRRVYTGPNPLHNR